MITRQILTKAINEISKFFDPILRVSVLFGQLVKLFAKLNELKCYSVVTSCEQFQSTSVPLTLKVFSGLG